MAVPVRLALFFSLALAIGCAGVQLPVPADASMGWLTGIKTLEAATKKKGALVDVRGGCA